MLRMPFLRRGERLCAGLDLEAGRAVLVRGGPAGPEVAARAEVPPLPDPADTALALLEGLGAPGAPAVVGLAGEGVMVKALRLPGDLRPGDLPEAVRWQFADAAEKERLIVRFAALGRSPDGRHEVLAAAVPEALARERLAPLRDAGVRLLAADLRACALWRAAARLAGEGEGPLAAVEVSPSGARAACGRGRLEFAREISGENLEFEIRRTLGYWQSQYGAGEAAVLRLGPSAEDGEARFAAALGLALWPFADPGLDFLPRDLRRARRVEGAAAPGLKARAVAAAGLLVLAAPWAFALAWGIQARSLEREAAALAPKAAEARKIRAERQALEEWAGIAESFEPAPLAPAVGDLRYAVPRGVWLTEVEFGPEQKAAAAPQAQRKAAPQGQAQRPAAGGSGEGPEEAGQGGQPKPAAARAEGRGLPPEPSVFRAEGYSLDAASVGLFRDNLAALPWCAGVESLKVEWDGKMGAYRFEIAARLKGSEAGGGSR